ncbi:Replication initiation factor [Lampropedia hyalina DSM 16112]|jgi:phage replication initiation protein|uniref:Replication initiation factor n=1 Tax=Lampropedia hyalina DSM 16112 TaxID=1122156 RepID=A0A1M5ADH2_9BURK|nr:replication initiation factor domain-containing protein [Lampropedia hyalina]SHF27962.1 Replication initiation factor [Lampropedia hyalina DSM 16112]
MTRVNPLALDGNTVKLRLLANRQDTQTHIAVDWLRFTVDTAINHAAIFPPDLPDIRHWYGLNLDGDQNLSEAQWHQAAQAKDLADEVAEYLGPDYYIDALIRKGHDFYRHRISIMRHGHECGWVGFGASSEHKNQRKQARTIHVNLYGHACTFAASGWQSKIARMLDYRKARITRVDLALDIFDAGHGFIDRCETDYNNRLMDVHGRTLECNHVGNWSNINPHSRSFYVGSKEAGKQTNIYEKGHQLFGKTSGSTWCRIELRYGNKLRILPSDILTRPADYFAGASDWHAHILREQEQQHPVLPQKIECKKRLAVETVNAECWRALKWVTETAGPNVLMAARGLGEKFWDLIEHADKPQRLRKFSDSELMTAYDRIYRNFAGAACPG